MNKEIAINVQSVKSRDKRELAQKDVTVKRIVVYGTVAVQIDFWEKRSLNLADSHVGEDFSTRCFART